MRTGVAADRAGGALVPLGDALEGYLRDSGLEGALARLRAIDAWPAAVGERVSEVTRPVEVRGETLVVEVSSSAWINELAMMSTLILKRVNGCTDGPPIGRLRFRLAETAASRGRSTMMRREHVNR